MSKLSKLQILRHFTYKSNGHLKVLFHCTISTLGYADKADETWDENEDYTKFKCATKLCTLSIGRECYLFLPCNMLYKIAVVKKFNFFF